MEKEDTYRARWAPGASYHVYNRAIPLHLLFVDDAARAKFLAKLKRLHPVCIIYAYALMGTHFHLHLRIRAEEDIRQRLLRLYRPLKLQQAWLEGRINFQKLVGDAFARSFHAYVKHYNTKNNRTGVLFDGTVRRLRVRDDLTSRSLCAYLHSQFIKHQLGTKVGGHGIATSFSAFEAGKSNFVDVEAVLERFGGEQAFMSYHRTYAAKRRAALERFNEKRFFGYTPPNQQLPPWALYRGEEYVDWDY